MNNYEIIVRLHKGKDIQQLAHDFAIYELVVQRRLAINLNIWLLSSNNHSVVTDDLLQTISKHPHVLMTQRNHATTSRKTSLVG